MRGGAGLGWAGLGWTGGWGQDSLIAVLRSESLIDRQCRARVHHHILISF